MMRRIAPHIAFVLAITVIASAFPFMGSTAYAQSANNVIAKCSATMFLDSLTGGLLEAGTDQLAAGAARLATTIGGPALSIVSSIFGGDSILRGLGTGGDPVNDAEVRKATKKRNFDACVEAAMDAIFKVALAKLKKRLLDRMTDDIIGWINGEGDPKFITNFGDYLEDAAQAAVGDTVRAVGLAELCSPLKYRLPALLSPVPTFTRQASCTLDDIVENIEGFYEDFSRGGPLAYAESFNPNNNLFGAIFATQDQIMRETAKKKEEATAAATIGGGYTPVEQCTEWTATSYAITLGRLKETKKSVNILFDYPNPIFPPAPGTATYVDVERELGGGPIMFACTRKEWSIPPGGTQQIAAIPYVTDAQVIASSDDLSPYVNAIFDAAVNRVIKAGVKGLRGKLSDLQSESTTGRAPQTYPGGDPYISYGKEYENAINLTAQLRTELTTQIDGARSDVTAASTTLTQLTELNNELLVAATPLADCELGRVETSYQMCSNTSSTLALARAREFQFVSDRDALTDILAGIEDAETRFSDNPSMGDGELGALLTSITSTRSTLRAAKDRFELANTFINSEIDRNNQALQVCQTGSYSCDWTPPPSS